MTDLQIKYQQKIVPELIKAWQLSSPLAVPKVEKVVVNMGLGEAVEDKGIIEKAAETLSVITGQQPKVTQSRLSISGFKLRAGQPIGLMVTLRGQRMYDFLTKLFTIVLPRLRDFQGVSPDGFDGRGNYSLGLTEQIVFPEVDYEKLDKVRGLQITIVTNTDDDERAKELLARLGMPFTKKEQV